MVSGLLAKFFPPPKFLAQPVIGLDVSDRSLKYIKLTPDRKNFTVDFFGEQSIPVGFVDSGQIKNRAGLGQTLKILRQGLKDPFAVVSLPEEHAFILRLSLPYMAPAEIRQSLELQLEQYVPLKPGEAVFDYEVLKRAEEPGENYDLAVTVFPKPLILDYQAVLTGAGFEPLAYEIEAQAIARAVVHRHDPITAMIIDFGKTRTSFFITKSQKVLFTSTLSGVGGESLTQSIKKNLKVDYETAQKLKEKHGLLANQNKELIYALMPTVSVLRDEVNKIYNYWNTRQTNEEIGPREPINQLIVCGGQATLPGLVEYLAASFTVPINLGDVWTNVLPVGQITPPITLNQSQKYATAIGLALRQYYD